MRNNSQLDFLGSNLTFGGSGESYLESRVHRSAKRTEKTRYCFRERKAYALWRRLLISSFPDSHRFQECSSNRHSFGPAQQSLQRRRVATGNPLSHDSRSGADRNHIPVTSQWRFPILEWAGDLSRCQYPAPLLVTDGAARLCPGCASFTIAFC